MRHENNQRSSSTHADMVNVKIKDLSMRRRGRTMMVLLMLCVRVCDICRRRKLEREQRCRNPSVNHNGESEEVWLRGWGPAQPWQPPNPGSSWLYKRSVLRPDRQPLRTVPVTTLCPQTQQPPSPPPSSNHFERRQHGSSEDVPGQTVALLPDPQPAAPSGPG